MTHIAVCVAILFLEISVVEYRGGRSGSDAEKAEQRERDRQAKHDS